MIKLLLVFIVVLSFSLPAVNGQAEGTGYAAVLVVTYPGVEMRRANTAEWLPLPVQAEAPFGAGDAVRTDDTGRAMVTFGEQVEVFVLPGSTYELTAFAEDATKQVQLSAGVTGHLIQRLAPGAQLDAYRLEGEDLVVTEPATLLGVWSVEGAYSVVLAAEGDAQVTIGEDVLEVPQGHGIRASQTTTPTVTELAAPLNAARLIGQLDGCPGVTKTLDNLSVNVRVAPGLDSTVIGSIDNKMAVRVLGISQSGNWYRIQAFSGFGWMQAPLVTNACTDLPVSPPGTIEHNVAVSGVAPAELELLLPFYGPPAEDLWFYRGVESPS